MTALVIRRAKLPGSGTGQPPMQGVSLRITAFVGRLRMDTSEDALCNVICWYSVFKIR